MEYRTMTRQQLANEFEISPKTLARRMEKCLKPKFLKHIKNKCLLFENEVKYIHEGITGMNIKW